MTAERKTAGAESVHWEHFPHEADIGVRGCGGSLAAAFEQCALAMSAVICEPERIKPDRSVEIACAASDPELLLYEWLNALVFEMATRHMLFGKFEVAIGDDSLRAVVAGEAVNVDRHEPRVEIKGATFTELRVGHEPDGNWCAQCVLDV